MITAQTLTARASQLEGEVFFKTGAASQIAFDILSLPSLPSHVAETEVQGVVFNAIYRALHKGDQNAAQSVVEQIFPGWSVSTLAGGCGDSAGILPNYDDELRGPGLRAHFPPEVWAVGEHVHANAYIHRAPANMGECRTAIATIIAVLAALDLIASLAALDKVVAEEQAKEAGERPAGETPAAPVVKVWPFRMPRLTVVEGG